MTVDDYLDEAAPVEGEAEAAEAPDEGTALSQAVLDAIDAKDAGGLYEAMSALVEHCAMSGPPSGKGKGGKSGIVVKLG